MTTFKPVKILFFFDSQLTGLIQNKTKYCNTKAFYKTHGVYSYNQWNYFQWAFSLDHELHSMNITHWTVSSTQWTLLTRPWVALSKHYSLDSVSITHWTLSSTQWALLTGPWVFLSELTHWTVNSTQWALLTGPRVVLSEHYWKI